MRYIILYILLLQVLPGYSQSDTTTGNYEYALIEAARQKMLGNIEESAKLYSRVIAYNPDCYVAYFELGSIYIASKKAEDAENFYSKAYKFDSDNYWYMTAYAGVLRINKKYDEAIKVLRKFPLTNDNRNNILFSLAETYAEKGKEKKALDILNKMERENGFSEKLLLMKVDLYQNNNEFEKGKSEILKLINRFPESIHYQIIMAEYLSNFEKLVESVKFYEAVYKMDTTNLFAITNLTDYYTTQKNNPLGFYYLNRALTLPHVSVDNKLNAVLYYINSDSEMKVNKTKILELIQTLRQVYPENYHVKTVLYDFYNKTNDTEKAYEIVVDILREKKDNYILWQQALYNASILNKADDMINYGKEALKYFPNKREIYLFIGLGYFQNEDYANCFSSLIDNVDYIKENNFLIQFNYFIAESAYKIGQKEKSFEFFEKLIKLDPDNYLALNNYSYYLSLDKTNLDRAKELSFKTIKKEPANSVYLDTYGWILNQLGQYEEAEIYIKKAIDSGVNDPDVFFHYGEVLYNQHKHNDALEYYRLALEKGYDAVIIEEKIFNIENEN